MNFKDRIVGYGKKPASEFQPNPLNARTHPEKQRRAVKASLHELGWIAPVIENVRTGRLIDGHERISQAGTDDVPFIQVDLAPEEENLALAVFDRITNMAGLDPGVLNALLENVITNDADLQAVLSDLAVDAGIIPIPNENKIIDEEKLAETNIECPKCGFKWMN